MTTNPTTDPKTDRRLAQAERDQAICAYYQQGHTIRETGIALGVSHQRVSQVLRKAGIATRKSAGAKRFLGVTVDPAVKQSLEEEHEKTGRSVSEIVNEKLQPTMEEK